MAERSFAKEVQALRLGEGEIFRGEGILAVAKGLLQSGVSYIGGYQGAPISHMMDVMNDAKEIREELGVHFENCANEAGAAAMLAASILYPVRGAVTWKSVVGTNVASDALSNAASVGVKGGALVVIGEDYGEGSSIMQERTHAFAMKSSMWLLDPRPEPAAIVKMVEHGFELSEATNTPVLLTMRIRACHVYGEFVAKDNRPGRFNGKDKIPEAIFDESKVLLPPYSYMQENDKVSRRRPRAIDYIRDNKLNEVLDGTAKDVGIIVQGGIYNTLNRALERLNLSDAHGNSVFPTYVMNVTYPLVPDEIKEFCADKKAVLVVEEGQPNYIETEIAAMLRDTNIKTRLHGKDILPPAGEYKARLLMDGIRAFVEQTRPDGLDSDQVEQRWQYLDSQIRQSMEAMDAAVPPRPPGFCVGCPERPFFSALKMVEGEIGKVHVTGDIGCHHFASLAPFQLVQHTMGYGLGAASASGLQANMKGRVLALMGDGGFWHNGLTSGIANAVFNNDDVVVAVIDNRYSAATGHQNIPSTGRTADGVPTHMSIESAVRGVGAKWVRVVDSYDVELMRSTLLEAMTTTHSGPKIIVVSGECRLAKQRRVRQEFADTVGNGRRAIRTRLGVDEDVCTGDHACIRLSGCPSLTLKDNPDPLKDDPVAYIDNNCVGCGNCGVVAQEAGLCPSFYRAEIIHNPNWLDRLLAGIRRRFAREETLAFHPDDQMREAAE